MIGSVWPMFIRLMMFCAVVLQEAVTAAAAEPKTVATLQDRQAFEACWADAERLGQENKPAEALASLEQALVLQQKLSGEASPQSVYILSCIARTHEEQRQFSKAESRWRRVLDAMTEQYGPDDWQTVDARRALETCRLCASLSPEQLDRLETASKQMDEARRLYHEGKTSEAFEPARKSLETRRQILGEKSPEYFAALSNLANLHLASGDYAAAEPLLQEAARINRKALGRQHPGYARTLNDLAGLYQSTGDLVKAETLLAEALQVIGDGMGRHNADYAIALNNLAGLNYMLRRYERAEPLYLQALQLRKEILGDRHPDYALSINNLAGLYEAQGDHARAEQLFQKALDLRRGILGIEHPDYAESLNGLAGLYRATGRLAAALPLYRQAVDINRKVLGEKHPGYAVSLNNLAAAYRSLGEYDKADPLYQQALEIVGGLLDDSFAVLSERQQLAMVRSFRQTLDGYLSMALRPDGDGAQAYASVLTWKGTVFSRQRQTKLAAAQPELAPLLAELRETTGRLATLAFAVPVPEQQQAWRNRLEDLSQEKERLEADLARRSEAFRKSSQRVTPDVVQAALPADVVLVDFVEYDRVLSGSQSEAGTQTERHLAAFVVRRGSPVAALDLGPAIPIQEAIGRWLKTYGNSRAAVAAAGELRGRIWEPLGKHLGSARTVLVSPDGALARFPLAALPGDEAGSYLIETYAIAVIPVPQRLPEMLGGPPAGPAADATLLLVGDVDYDAPQDAPAGEQRSGLGRSAAFRFSRLESTRAEILVVQDSFEQAYQDGEVKKLRGRNATEEQFRETAPQHRFVHLATHGFFAPAPLDALSSPSRDAAAAPADEPHLLADGDLAALHPGLLSALVFAGVNRPPQPGAGDGLLTAEEVASLNLEGMELAVLSACETGLGKLVDAEGALGLQRAFQVAGARSVVATLWKVNDEATSILMQHFYENFWTKKLRKLEALRQAQLWMLREGPDRGMAVVGRSQPATSGRRPPFLWAAFVLSGDWR